MHFNLEIFLKIAKIAKLKVSAKFHVIRYIKCFVVYRTWTLKDICYTLSLPPMNNHWDSVSYHASRLLKYNIYGTKVCIWVIQGHKYTPTQKKLWFWMARFDTVVYGRHSLGYQGPFICLKVSGELRKKLNKLQSIQQPYTWCGPFKPYR